MKKIIYSFLILGIGVLSSCGSDDSSGSPEPDPPAPAPKAAQLIFPEKDKECTSGTSVNDSESKVTFKWSASENTDSYEVILKNLETNAIKRVASSSNQATITILKGVPYEWNVVSKSKKNSATAKSDVWRFYNEGGVSNYAPFPANAVSPSRGSTIDLVSSITLSWSGSDVDGDIKDYEVFFGTDNPPATSLGVTTSTTQNATLGAGAGTIYYWIVKTTDDFGNSSMSEVFEFKVN